MIKHDSKFLLICEWTMKLAYLNLLWIFFTLMGLVVFGLMPATTATFAIVRKWINSQDVDNLSKVFWSEYKSSFLRSNLLGTVIAVIGFILFIDLQFFLYFNTESAVLQFLLITFFFVILIVFLTFILFVVPVFVHFNLTIFQCMKYALIIGVAYPAKSLIMLTGIALLYVLMTAFSWLIPFFSVSVFCFIIMFIANQAFSDMEDKKNLKTVQVTSETRSGSMKPLGIQE